MLLVVTMDNATGRVPANPSTFSSVCAVIDIQGFHCIENDATLTFFPRELSVIGSRKEINLEYDMPPAYYASPSSYSSSGFHNQAKVVHGIPVIPKDLSLCRNPDHIYRDLRHIYDVFSTNKKNLVACSNLFVARYLEKLKLPHIDLNRGPLIAPHLSELDQKYDGNWVCSLHEKRENMICVCAERKARELNRWLLENRERALDFIKESDN